MEVSTQVCLQVVVRDWGSTAPGLVQFRIDSCNTPSKSQSSECYFLCYTLSHRSYAAVALPRRPKKLQNAVEAQ